MGKPSFLQMGTPSFLHFSCECPDKGYPTETSEVFWKVQIWSICRGQICLLIETTVYDPRPKIRSRTIQKDKPPGTAIVIKTLSRTAEVENPLLGKRNAIKPTKVTLDTGDPEVEIELTNPVDEQHSNPAAPPTHHLNWTEPLEMIDWDSNAMSRRWSCKRFTITFISWKHAPRTTYCREACLYVWKSTLCNRLTSCLLHAYK